MLCTLSLGRGAADEARAHCERALAGGAPVDLRGSHR
jgi:hypothetical protein